jgi:hypothetical protein
MFFSTSYVLSHQIDALPGTYRYYQYPVRTDNTGTGKGIFVEGHGVGPLLGKRASVVWSCQHCSKKSLLVPVDASIKHHHTSYRTPVYSEAIQKGQHQNSTMMDRHEKGTNFGQRASVVRIVFCYTLYQKDQKTPFFRDLEEYSEYTRTDIVAGRGWLLLLWYENHM